MEIIKENNKVYILDENNKDIAHINFDNVDKNTVCITETKVDKSLQGQGIAGKLMAAAYEVIKNNNMKTLMTCSYALNWFKKHPDKQDILAKDIEECACDIAPCKL